MKAIMVMFDSLNRRMLPPYGCDWVHAPNFQRLAERAATFDNCYVGSMPCIPARRELHTGRYNFLHRSWGPIEPFDDSLPELLKKNGVYTHLTTDHQHYFEDGGCTYHHRYNTWEFARGQEGDCWKGEVGDPEIPPNIKQIIKPMWRQDWVNRKYFKTEADLPQAQAFARGLEFIRSNREADNWFLQIETFDPHEPFFVPEHYLALYPDDYEGPHFDWPDYYMVTETREQVRHLRYRYAALVSMCDHYLGKVLDLMDELELWDDTLLIVNTDHGILLGEHDCWLKNYQPLYNEIAHIPLFIWDPRSRVRGERRSSLVQMIDIAPTLLEYFGLPVPADMQGRPLRETIAVDTPVREAALFGYHGCHVNITDGRHVYMRAPTRPDNHPLFEYTLMPTHIKHFFSTGELQDIQLVEPFSFSKGARLMKIEGLGSVGTLNPYLWGSLLFDLDADPEQLNPLQDEALERRLLGLMIDLMRASDAPPEQYERLGLPARGPLEDRHLNLQRTLPSQAQIGVITATWSGKASLVYHTLLHLIPFPLQRQFLQALEVRLQEEGVDVLDEHRIGELMQQVAPPEFTQSLRLFTRLVKEMAPDA
jgi:arylsulfatase A-like enzyme